MGPHRSAPHVQNPKVSLDSSLNMLYDSSCSDQVSNAGTSILRGRSVGGPVLMAVRLVVVVIGPGSKMGNGHGNRTEAGDVVTLRRRFAALEAANEKLRERVAMLERVRDDGSGQPTTAERIIQEREAMLRGAVEAAGEAIAIVGEQGVFLFLNRAAGRVLGGKPSDLTGKTMWDFFPRPIADRQMAVIRKVIHAASGTALLTKLCIRGESRWYGTTVEPLRDAEERVSAALVIARDVHELQVARQELETYRKKMTKAEHRASLGTLSATFAHELTQPLTVIRLSLQNAMKDIEGTCPSPTALADLAEGVEAVSNIAAIIERFRTFARKASDRAVSAVIFATTARRVMRLLEESARNAGIALEVEHLDDLPPIYANEKDLEQVFFSLAQNAIQAAGAPGNRYFRIAGTRRDGEVELRFEDNCGGIAPENLQRVFEPFFTTKRPGEGTGLGLCVVQRVVAQIGGRIRVESRFGRGAAFIVTLPIEGK